MLGGTRATRLETNTSRLALLGPDNMLKEYYFIIGLNTGHSSSWVKTKEVSG